MAPGLHLRNIALCVLLQSLECSSTDCHFIVQFLTSLPVCCLAGDRRVVKTLVRNRHSMLPPCNMRCQHQPPALANPPAGICHTDYHQINDEWGGGIFPMVPGHEIVGIVTEVGPKVKSLKPGDRVGVGCFVESCMKCDRCAALCTLLPHPSVLACRWHSQALQQAQPITDLSGQAASAVAAGAF